VNFLSVYLSSQRKVFSSASIRPALAPISIAMLAMVNLPSMVRAATASPVYSADIYVAPSAVTSPIRYSIRSLEYTPLGKVPLQTNLKVSGTLNHMRPEISPPARSVDPTPVEKAFRAP